MIEVLFFIVLIPSVIIHEVTHGVVALAFGDDTAKKAWRLTLNPIKHVDPIGTIIVPILMLVTVHVAFGWAKPVPVNLSKLRNPRNHGLIVSISGPLVNLAIAVMAGVGLRIVAPIYTSIYTSVGQLPLIVQLLFLLGFVNVLLAVFNIIPIPPLDGSALLERMLPSSWWPQYLRMRMFFLPVVLIVVLMFPGALDAIFNPALRIWAHIA